MIQSYRDRYQDASIAILGSGPSITLFEGKEDLSIALNGSAFLFGQYDIYMTGDKQAPMRHWWDESLTNHDAIRLISSYVAPFDEKLYPNITDRKILQDRLASHNQSQITHQNDSGLDNENAYVHFVPDSTPASPHAYFRFGGFGLAFTNHINKDQERLYWGGTIAAIALQTANIMGSKDVHLYGCSFMNTSGKDYFYTCPDDQKGSINDEQRSMMQATMDTLRSFGVKITVHGKSSLQ